MKYVLIIYIAATLLGVLTGWGFAVPLRDIVDAPPRDNPWLWMLIFGLVSPASVWLFLRDTIR